MMQRRAYVPQSIGISYSENPKEYMRQYYAAHAETFKRRANKRHQSMQCDEAYKIQKRDALRVWRKNNPDKLKMQSRTYYHANRARFIAWTENRRMQRIAGGPMWTKQDILSQYDSQNGRCMYCCRNLFIDEFHSDHIIPLSGGGTNSRENLAIACSFCNVSKGSQSAMSFMLRMMS